MFPLRTHPGRDSMMTSKGIAYFPKMFRGRGRRAPRPPRAGELHASAREMTECQTPCRANVAEALSSKYGRTSVQRKRLRRADGSHAFTRETTECQRPCRANMAHVQPESGLACLLDEMECVPGSICTPNTAVERIWHTQISKGQILAVVFRWKSGWAG